MGDSQTDPKPRVVTDWGTLDFGDLRATGLLWLINRVVFHPRGFALALAFDRAGKAIGWQLLGDGTEVWQYGLSDFSETELMAAAEQTLRKRKADDE